MTHHSRYLASCHRFGSSSSSSSPLRLVLSRGRRDHSMVVQRSYSSTRPSCLSSSSSLSTLLWNPTEEHAALRNMLRSFVADEVEPQANEYNKRELFNTDLFRKLGNAEGGVPAVPSLATTNTMNSSSTDTTTPSTSGTVTGLGLLGLTVSEEIYGGTGWTDHTATAVAIVHEELSYADPAFCLSYLAHSLLLVNNLNVNGTHEQKLRLLPKACAGTHIGGMCMSEPNAGTDVLGMQTKAIPTDAGDWVLSGNKMWITNGTLDGTSTGDLFLVYARTGKSKTDITQFVVEKGMPGFTLGQKIVDKLGMRASMTAELVFDNVVIPSDNVVGQVNEATLCMMRNLEIERVGLAAMALGIARRCIDEMKQYALQRQAFGARSLFEFGQIQRLIAESYAEYMAGRSYVYAFANTLDLKSHGNGLDADGTKLFCANMAKQIADRAIQVMGGYGYTGEYKVERLWRDAKLLEIGGGTNESHHKNITRDLRKMGSTPLD